MRKTLYGIVLLLGIISSNAFAEPATKTKDYRSYSSEVASNKFTKSIKRQVSRKGATSFNIVYGPKGNAKSNSITLSSTANLFYSRISHSG